jgi:tetratricopeptide (TPR) repeat protein
VSKIFICYRRAEDAFAVRGICIRLNEAFGAENVFRDVDGVKAGDNWREVLAAKVNECDILLAIIGPRWLATLDAAARRRIDSDDDWVRFEIETALTRCVTVVPVMLQQGDIRPSMPTRSDLPRSLADLADRQASTVRASDFEGDLEKLIRDLREHERAAAELERTFHAFMAKVAQGSWPEARQLLEDALTGAGAERRRLPAYARLAQHQADARSLQSAASAFERNDFAAAHSLLSQVTLTPLPPCVEASLGVAAIGRELGQGTAATAEQVGSALTALDRLHERVARTTPHPVPGEAAIRNLLGEHERKASFESALKHYECGRFASAARDFERARDYRDATQRLARIAVWTHVQEAMQHGNWQDARSHLRGLRDREDETRVRSLRQWCLVADKFLPMLELMSGGGRLAEPGVPWEGGNSPYAVLHVPPALTHADALELGYDHPGEKESCDVLRVPEKRLLVDFGTYAVRNPVRVKSVIKRYFSFGPQENLDSFIGHIFASVPEAANNDGSALSQHILAAVETELGEDAGILFALLRNHEAACQRFLELARCNPADHIALHHLGLAACAKAHLGPESPGVSDAWNLVCVAWGAVFADDRFWNAWWAQLRRIYPVTENQQVQEARKRLLRFWLDELKGVEGLGENPADAFAIEVDSARTLAALKGLGSGSRRAVVGTRGLVTFGLEAAFCELQASFSAKNAAAATTRKALCIAFSRLALPRAMIDAGRHSEAIAALQAIAPAPGRCLAAADIGYTCLPDGLGARLFRESHADMARTAHLKLAYAEISQVPPELDAAFVHWDEALRLAAACNAREDTLGQIRDVVIGRNQALRAATGSKHEQLNCLDSAVHLIAEASSRAWDTPEMLLRQEHVDTLLDRAVYLSNVFDMEKESRSDAQAAYALLPESLRATHVLCSASLHYAKQLSSEGRRDLAAGLVNEVLMLVADGEKRFPGNPDLAKVRGYSDTLMELLKGDAEEALARVLKGLSSLTESVIPAARDSADGRLQQALQLEAQGEYERATELYWELAQANPADRELRGKLCHCYREWICRTAQAEELDECRRITDIAKERCADSAILKDVFESMQNGEGS